MNRTVSLDSNLKRPELSPLPVANAATFGGMDHPTLSRREALRARRSRPTRVTIPTGVSPHVRLVFEEMRRQGVTYDRVEEISGVLRSTLKAWRHKNRPGLESIEAVLGALGWDFVPIPRAKVLPKPLAEEIGAVATRHGLTVEQALETLVALVTRIHARKPNEADLQGAGQGSAAA